MKSGNDLVLQLKDVVQELKQSSGKNKKILNEVSFSIPKGSLTGFVGVNGAGKTTTIKTIFEFIPKTSGDILFFNNQKFSRDIRHQIGFLPERPYFYDFLTGEEFLLLHWELQGFKAGDEFQKRCDEILEIVDLRRAKKQRLRQFSKGMLQRIGIAQSILHKPPFLIWDEPMSGLDPDGRYMVKQIMKDMHSQGITLFFSSHLLQDMQELCDRLVIIDQGSIVFEGEKTKIMQIHSEEREIAWRTPGSAELQKVFLPISAVAQKIREIQNQNGEIEWVERVQWNLEDAFRKLRTHRDMQKCNN